MLTMTPDGYGTVLRVPIATGISWSDIANAVVDQQLSWSDGVSATAERERHLLALNFQMYGSGQVTGRYRTTWEREGREFTVRTCPAC